MANSLALHEGEELSLTGETSIRVELAWDILGDTQVDLDASCAFFDEFGHLVDAVFYNQLEIFDGAAVHSGDNRTGEGEGADETVTIHLNKLPDDIKACVVIVNCHEGGTFEHVETATASVLGGSEDEGYTRDLASLALGCVGRHNAFILCTIFVDDGGQWKLCNNGHAAMGATFHEAEGFMRDTLVAKGILSNDLILEGETWDPRDGKTFVLEKGNIIRIPGLTGVTLGLGWDSRVDVDASCLMFSQDMLIDNVFFGHLASNDGSVKHSGDNTTGEGDGDDEQIVVTLNKVSEAVCHLFFVVNIYTSGHSFAEVHGCYVRLVDNKSKKEACRYTLSDSGHSNAQVMCRVSRAGIGSNDWYIEAIGDEANGGMAADLVPTILQNYRLTLGPPPPPPWSETRITHISCAGLMAADSNGFSDPYVIFKIGKKTKKTSTKTKCLDPVYEGEEIELPAGSGGDNTLFITCYDKDMFGKDLIGETSYDLGPLPQNTPMPLTLSWDDPVHTGTITFTVNKVAQ